IPDTQALCGWSGPGPFKIVNNFLSSAGENVNMGGPYASIPNLVPSDMEIRGNYFFKPLSWKVGDPSYAGIHWGVKNLFELKNGQRILFTGNMLQNNWIDAQNGFALLLTPYNTSGTNIWVTVSDITITGNTFINV